MIPVILMLYNIKLVPPLAMGVRTCMLFVLLPVAACNCFLVFCDFKAASQTHVKHHHTVIRIAETQKYITTMQQLLG